MVTVDGKYSKDVRREYQREYRKKRKNEEKGKRKGVEGDFGEFLEHVRNEALKKGASSAIMGIYKEMLKLSTLMGTRQGMSGDEIAMLLLKAERELKEDGYRDRDDTVTSHI